MSRVRDTKPLLAIISEIAEKFLEQVAKGEISDLEKDLKKRLKEEVQEKVTLNTWCPQWKINLVKARLEDLIRAEKLLGNYVVVLEAVLEDVGLVGASSGVLNAVLEVGLAWDHLLDLPLVPGSSLKGAFRNTLLLLCVDRLGKSKKEERKKCLEHIAGLLGWLPGAYDIRQVAELLGLDEKEVKSIAEKHVHAGLLIFHDAHLLCNEKGRLLEPWVITPHYRDAKTEYDARPVPVEHVVLAPGLRAVFVVGVRREAEEPLEGLAELLGVGSCGRRGCLIFLAQLLGATLASGVGARTSRGYSRFRVEKVYMRW